MLAAVAERAVVTTLVTSEGRSLTEVTLTIKNQAQPFMKVDLPQGASILSADVAGEKVKPVQGTDGNRVPLLRANFRPNGPYTVPTGLTPFHSYLCTPAARLRAKVDRNSLFQKWTFPSA